MWANFELGIQSFSFIHCLHQGFPLFENCCQFYLRKPQAPAAGVKGFRTKETGGVWCLKGGDKWLYYKTLIKDTVFM